MQIPGCLQTQLRQIISAHGGDILHSTPKMVMLIGEIVLCIDECQPDNRERATHRGGFLTKRALVLRLLLLLTCGTVNAANAQIPLDHRIEHDVLIVAHADDWQLFAGDVVAARLLRGDFVTVIQVTKGLDSVDRWCWEKGQIASLITATQDPRSPAKTLDCNAKSYDPASCGHRTINGHAIFNCHYQNRFSIYFLRLSGTIEPGHNRNDIPPGLEIHNTVRHLYDGTVSSLSSVDGATSYSSFDDLAQTIAAISGRCTEGYYGSFGWCHTSNVFASNPLGSTRTPLPDHEDHTTTGCLAIHVALSIGSISINLFSGYDGPGAATQDPLIRARKLSDLELNTKKRLFIKAFGGTLQSRDGVGDVESNEYHSWMEWTDWGIDNFPPTPFSSNASRYWSRLEDACSKLSTRQNAQ